MHDIAIFTGFSPVAHQFLKDLKANNNREWFAANKKVCEKELRDPAKAFCAAMTQQLHARTGSVHISKTFRINRDIRFSKDKTPYNAHLHILFRKEGSPAAVYFGWDIDKLILGAGVFSFEGEQLNAYRQGVAGPSGIELQDIVDGHIEKGARMNPPPLKRVPTGFDKDHPRGELLKRKGLALWIDLDPMVAAQEDVVMVADRTYESLEPLTAWMERVL